MLSLFGIYLLLSTAYASKHNVELTADNFHMVTSSDDIWFVKFYATWCGHCKNLAPKWENAASVHHPFVKFGEVDVDQHKSLASKYGVNAYPTILIFSSDKQNPEKFNGRDEDAISKEVLRQIQSVIQKRMGKDEEQPSGVIELTDATFSQVLEDKDPWLVAFIAPWCGHCQRLEPEWNKAAERVKRVKMGRVDATKYTSLAAKYGVQGYPTIKFFPADSKSSPQNYDGGRQADEIIQWVDTRVPEYIPVPELVEITSPEVFKRVCESHSLCVITIVPPLWDCQSECRNKFLAMLKTETEKFKKQDWGWGWVSGLSHPELETALEVGEANYPALAIMSVPKKISSRMIVSFSQDNVHQFLGAIAHGQSVSGAKFDTVPTIQTVDPWDGKDMAFDDDEMDYNTKEEL